MAVASSNTLVPPRSAAADAMQSKKTELLAAGRRKLEEYKKKNKKTEKIDAKNAKGGENHTSALPKSTDGEGLHDDSATTNINTPNWSLLQNNSSGPNISSALDQIGATSAGGLLVQASSFVTENMNQQHEDFERNTEGKTKAEERKIGKDTKATATSGKKYASAAHETPVHLGGGNSAHVLDRLKWPNGVYPVLGSELHNSILPDSQPSSVSKKEKDSAIQGTSSAESDLFKSKFETDSFESQLSTSMVDSFLTEEKVDFQMPDSMNFSPLSLSTSMASNKVHPSANVVTPPSSMSATFPLPSVTLPVSTSLASSQNTRSQFAWEPSANVVPLVSHPSLFSSLPCTSASAKPLREVPLTLVSSQFPSQLNWPSSTSTFSLPSSTYTSELTSLSSSLPASFTRSDELASTFISASPSPAVTIPSAPLPSLPSMANQSASSQDSWPSSPVVSLSFPAVAAAQHPSLPLSLSDTFSMSLSHASVPSSHVTLSTTEEVMPLQSPLPVKPLHEGQETLGGPISKNWLRLQQQASERDEFAALEQHIDDLTREKFSLQRALDAARSLTESLAQENSSLTENFNQQATIVNQLKTDLERQAEEIHAQALVLGSFREERERAQQESNSASERSQILAAEVIALEEKVLKLRSNELKLERDMESLKAENESYKRQILSMEKDQKNLRSMLEALQEEKKLLQGRIRKGTIASQQQTTGKDSLDMSNRKDVATSTDDLGVELNDNQPTDSLLSDTSTSRSEEGTNCNFASQSFIAKSAAPIPSLLNTQSLSMSAAPLSVPSDQLKIIENINLLITEFSTERDSLVKALNAQSSEAAKLRALNVELLQKLESQTQRLELAVAQNMAHGGPQMVNPYEQPQDDVEYLDEGDEVVERVLGWIMKLFPGGSSKRRSSKLL